jgi:hypothetical protein
MMLERRVGNAASDSISYRVRGATLTVGGSAGRPPAAGSGQAILAIKDQNLARVNAVRVLDIVEIHAPQLGPAPGAFQEQPGNGPQGITRLDGVAVGRIRPPTRSGARPFVPLRWQFAAALPKWGKFCAQAGAVTKALAIAVSAASLAIATVDLAIRCVVISCCSSRINLISYARFCAQALDSATFLAFCLCAAAQKWRK